MFTARTTWVSNPICAPSLHPSLSDPSSRDAFALVSPPKINIFYHFLECTSRVIRSPALQYLLPDLPLRDRISQETYKASYGCFRPNNCGCDLDCWDYRGGWHQSLPVLIPMPFYSTEKFLIEEHSDSLCHACAHCRKFPTAAPRRAGSSVSDSLSGLPR